MIDLNQMDLILLYIIGVNVIAFLIMGIDKRKARKQVWRIPERIFWILAIIGGAFGIWFGMKSFRHKTKHRIFLVGVPMIMLIDMGVITYIYFSMS